jgi:hypothetical protein
MDRDGGGNALPRHLCRAGRGAGQALDHAGDAVGPGADDRVLLGALLEVILAIVVTPVTLSRLVKREDDGLALG